MRKSKKMILVLAVLMIAAMIFTTCFAKNVVVTDSNEGGLIHGLGTTEENMVYTIARILPAVFGIEFLVVAIYTCVYYDKKYKNDMDKIVTTEEGDQRIEKIDRYDREKKRDELILQFMKGFIIFLILDIILYFIVINATFGIYLRSQPLNTVLNTDIMEMVGFFAFIICNVALVLYYIGMYFNTKVKIRRETETGAALDVKLLNHKFNFLITLSVVFLNMAIISQIVIVFFAKITK